MTTPTPTDTPADPPAPPQYLMQRLFGKVDGSTIIAVEPVPQYRGASELVEKLLLEDGREVYGCRKCDAVGETRSSIGSHQKKHAHEEGRAASQRNGKTPTRTGNGHAPIPAPRSPRSYEMIAAEIVAAEAHCQALKAEMAAALGLNNTWGRDR